MFRRLASTIKQFLTAIMLLMLVVLTIETVLQFRNGTHTVTVASTVPSRYQPWLVPSATVHHEMQRLNRAVKPDRVTFATNSLGLRGPELAVPQLQGGLRILVLGDDTILGAKLDDKHTVPARLRQFLSKATGLKIEVINAGVPGYCPLLSWLQYRHELKQIDPDIVILHVDMTDVADDASYRRKLKQSDQRQICVNSNLSLDKTAGRPFQQILQQSALIRLLQQKSGFSSGNARSARQRLRDSYEWTTASQTDLRLPVQHAMSPLEDLSTAADTEEFQLIVSCSPVPWQIADKKQFPEIAEVLSTASEWPVTTDVPFEILKALCEKSGVPLCSAVDAFRAFDRPTELYASDSEQLSSYGAALYAREIASMLLQRPELAGLFSGAANISSTSRKLN